MAETQQVLYGLARPPDLKREAIESYAVPVYLERLDTQFIEDIVIFPSARDRLAPDVQVLATRDFMQDQAAISMPEGSGRMRVVTAAGGGRSVPILCPDNAIPYNNQFLGGMVMEKGTISGNVLYTEKLIERDKELVVPWGFFGRKEADFEDNILSRLLDSGMRTSLPLGYIVLKNHLLKAYLTSEWKKAGNERVARLMEKGLSLIEESGDQAVLMFRVVDVADRIGNTSADLLKVTDPQTQKEKDRAKEHRIVQIARIAGLFAREAQMFPDSFQNYLHDTGLTKKDALQALHAVMQRKTLTEKQFLNYTTFLIGIVAANQRALGAATDKAILEHAMFPYTLGRTLSESKDISLGFMHNDVEESINETLGAWKKELVLHGYGLYREVCSCIEDIPVHEGPRLRHATPSNLCADIYNSIIPSIELKL